ncbi:dynein axonemal heavy chain 7-like [Lepeophtheirus salmonis]|uniref:dynein axonemal heavy chain 7-like n=1 Tax=Lepeophtheirus salmonis TaxID=72036 RepID=UPI003AF38B49
MYGGISQLDLPYAVRYRLRFNKDYKGPNTALEYEYNSNIRENKKFIPGIDIPNVQVRKDYDRRLRERRKRRKGIEDPQKETERTLEKIDAKILKNEPIKRPRRQSYMEMLHCGGKMPMPGKRMKKSVCNRGGSSRTNYKSYAESRKNREKFRKRLVEVIMHRDEWDDEDADPSWTGAPLTTKEKDLLRYYYYIHNGIDTRYVASMSSKWLKRIMTMVPRRLMKNQKGINNIHAEIRKDYLFAVKKSIVDFVLKEPEIDEDERFLDEDDETELTIELAGVSNAWKKLYIQSRKYLRLNLHPISSCLLQMLNLWYKSYDDLLWVNLNILHAKFEIMTYQDVIYQEVERVKGELKNKWLSSVLEIYKTCEKKRALPTNENRLNSLHACMAVQMTESIQRLCLLSMNEFNEFMVEINVLNGGGQVQGSKWSKKKKRKKSECSEVTRIEDSGFIIHLKMSESQIIFYPNFQDIELALLETYDIMLQATNGISRFEFVLDPPEDDEKPEYLKPIILENIVKNFKSNIIQIIRIQSQKPREYIKNYDTYMYLINGQADEDINDYVKEPHSFDEFSEKVISFDKLGKTLEETLPPIITLGIFELHCEDLIVSIHRKISVLREIILKKMSNDHQRQNHQLCERFEKISKTALSAPNNTEELVELKSKVNHIKNVIMLNMEKGLKEAARRLVFLSDYLQFTTAEMKSNTKTFQWQAKMPKVFDEHKKIIGEKTLEYQKALKLRRERFIDELESANQQVDDFFVRGRQ